MIITFSGLDGSGKSTLIRYLQNYLNENKYRVSCITMYDNIGVYAIIRYFRDKIIGRPDSVVADQSSEPATEKKRGLKIPELVMKLIRSNKLKRMVLIFDVIIFRLYQMYYVWIKKNILIIDRYFYDSLVDVTEHMGSLYVRFILFLAPDPLVSVFIDVDPETSFTRKGEYSVPILHRRYDLYMGIFQKVKRPFFLPNRELITAKESLRNEIDERILKK